MTLTIPAEEAKGTIDLEPGVYKATLQSMEQVDGQFGPQIKFVFALDGLTLEDSSPATLWAWSSWKMNPATKLHRWVQALGGPRPQVGTDYDLAALVGQHCRLLVEQKDTEDGPRPRVRDIMPGIVRTARPAAKPTASGGDGRCSECGEAVTTYDANGTPYCDAHAPEG